MCGRTTLTITADDLERTFGYEVPADYRPRYNVAPTQNQLAIVEGEGGAGFRELYWGLVPWWSDDPGIGSRLINARAESLFEKPAFRDSAKERRCLIVVDGFYEWQAATGGKRPHRIHRVDDRPFTLAGIWDRWKGGGEVLESCSIVTTKPNSVVEPLHDRMPVIIEPDDRKRWLLSSDPDQLRELLVPGDESQLAAYEVSRAVNDTANDSPACIEPGLGPAQLGLRLD